MHIINVSSSCTFKGQPCCPVLSQLSLFVAPDHTTEQQSMCDKSRTCLVDSVVKAEQHFIVDRLLPKSTCQSNGKVDGGDGYLQLLLLLSIPSFFSSECD